MACFRKRRGKWIIDYCDAKGKQRWETIEGSRKDAEDRLAKIIASGCASLTPTAISYREEIGRL